MNDHGSLLLSSIKKPEMIPDGIRQLLNQNDTDISHLFACIPTGSTVNTWSLISTLTVSPHPYLFLSLPVVIFLLLLQIPDKEEHDALRLAYWSAFNKALNTRFRHAGYGLYMDRQHLRTMPYDRQHKGLPWKTSQSLSLRATVPWLTKECRTTE
jgi:hypothetical protein